MDLKTGDVVFVVPNHHIQMRLVEVTGDKGKCFRQDPKTGESKEEWFPLAVLSKATANAPAIGQPRLPRY